LDIELLAEDLSGLIVENRPDPRLKWHADGSVQIRIGLVIPEKGPKQTMMRTNA
jgi:hypothetical protein